MRMPNGERIDPPIEAKIAQEIIEQLTPLLARIAQRGAALYDRALPIAPNFYAYANYDRSVSFAEDPGPEPSPDYGIMRFVTGIESARFHSFLLISKQSNRQFSIVRDYKVQPGESHLLELQATQPAPNSSFEHGEFALSVFKRIWQGSDQGRMEPEPALTSREIVGRHVRALNPVINSAESLVAQQQKGYIITRRG